MYTLFRALAVLCLRPNLPSFPSTFHNIPFPNTQLNTTRPKKTTRENGKEEMDAEDDE
jgi:hypothetical protein